MRQSERNGKKGRETGWTETTGDKERRGEREGYTHNDSLLVGPTRVYGMIIATAPFFQTLH